LSDKLREGLIFALLTRSVIMSLARRFNAGVGSTRHSSRRDD